MSIPVELGNDAGPLISVLPEPGCGEFIGDFARRCFFVGDFPARGKERHKWLLDCRVGLGEGATTRTIATEMVRCVQERELVQFVGAGFGAYLLVGAILGLQEHARGALLRGERKRYGRQQLVEGQLDPDKPVCLIDDVINSGESASHLVQALRREGYNPQHLLSIFRFSWGNGVQRLADEGIECSWLASVSKKKKSRRILSWLGM